LAAEQVEAVIAHERGHVRGRHHIAVLAAQSLVRSFPKVPLFVSAAAGIRQLIELCADDAAIRVHGRLPLAQALLALSGLEVPSTALGGAGEATALRIDRLLGSPTASSRWRARWALGLALLAVGLGPAVALAMPAIVEGWQVLTYCPVPAVA
jgi:Zn-dependent protease with chaperone function